MNKNQINDKGQNFAFVAIIMVGLVGILVLVIDGGQSYMHRRIAQTAADAGAYAGAWAYCKGGDDATVWERARIYAEDENNAELYQLDIADGQVTVTTRIGFNTFFAAFLGRPQAEVRAIAASGCGPPASGQFVLPVSWFCQPEISEVPGEGGEWEFDDCLIDGKPVADFGISLGELECRQHGGYNGVDCFGPLDLETFHATYTDDLFLVMDTDDVKNADQVCTTSDPPGNLNCDIDGDGEDDIIGAGGRAWLDLDGGGGGANEIMDWVELGFPDILNIHTWVPGETGGMGSAFSTVENYRVGNIALVPIGDFVCENDPSDGSPESTLCLNLSHPPEYVTGDTFISGTGNQYYHLAGFGAFYISCVDSHGGGSCDGLCPGHLLAHNTNPDYIACNAKTIEGYFISGLTLPNTGGGPGDPLNVGVEDLKLTK
jgi:hypothetical protein